jgi:hypothetical protein
MARKLATPYDRGSLARRIVDRSHPERPESMTGRIFLMDQHRELRALWSYPELVDR